jgi:DNA polymerase V
MHTDMAIWDALPLCPQAGYVKRDFRWYEVLSRKMLSIVRDNSPQVEFYSIDEQFFVVPDASSVFAQHLQRQIRASQRSYLTAGGRVRRCGQ